MSSTNRWKLKGCSGCCPTATDVVEPKLKSNPSFSDQKRGRCASSSGSRQPKNDTPTTAFSPNTSNSPQLINDSVAVVKDSDDPYRDFRQSMVEMMSEKEIYSRSDLQQLLRCFLDLNPPHHHEIIVRAFMDVWSGGGEERTPPCSA